MYSGSQSNPNQFINQSYGQAFAPNMGGQQQNFAGQFGQTQNFGQSINQGDPSAMMWQTGNGGNNMAQSYGSMMPPRSQTPDMGQMQNFQNTQMHGQYQNNSGHRPNFDMSGQFGPVSQFGGGQPIQQWYQLGQQQQRQGTPFGHSQANFMDTRMSGGFGNFGAMDPREAVKFLMESQDTDQVKLAFDDILKMCAEKVKYSPKNFFRKFNGHQNRKFEVWEIAAIFDLMPIQAQILVLTIEDPQAETQQFTDQYGNLLPPRLKFKGFGQYVSIADLVQKLKQCNGLQNLNFYDLPNKCAYTEKWDSLRDKQDYRDFASEVLKQAATSNTYSEAFQRVTKFAEHQGKAHIKCNDFTVGLRKLVKMSPEQERIWSSLLDYIQLDTEEAHSIHIVAFVAAMREVLQDYKLFDAQDIMNKVNSLYRPGRIDKIGQDELITDISSGVKRLSKFLQKADRDDQFKKVCRAQKSHVQSKFNYQGESDVDVIRLDDFVRFLNETKEHKITTQELTQLTEEYMAVLYNATTAEKSKLSADTQSIISTFKAYKEQHHLDLSLSQSLDPKATMKLGKSDSRDSLSVKGMKKDESKDSFNQRVSGETEPAAPEAKPNKFQSATVPENAREEAKMQTIAEEQEQIPEEDDYEWENDDDISREAPANQEEKKTQEAKEGGQLEMFDGGNKELEKSQRVPKKSVYLNLTKLTKDIELFRQLETDERSDQVKLLRALRFNVLEAFKGYSILIGESLMYMLKQGDRLGTMTKSKNSLEQTLRSITGLSAAEVETSAQALIYFFTNVSQKGRRCVNYIQLYQFYITYANQNMVMPPRDPRATKEEIDFQRVRPNKEGQHLVTRIEEGITKTRTKLKRNIPYTVKKNSFELALAKLHEGQGKSYQIDSVFERVKSYDPLHEKQQEVNVNTFFELVGFQHDLLPHYTQDSSFRSVCALIQGNFQFSLRRVPPQMRGHIPMEYFCMFILQLVPKDQLKDDLKRRKIIWSTIQQCKNRETQLVEGKEFIDKLQFGMMQLWYMERAALQFLDWEKKNPLRQFEEMFEDELDTPEKDQIAFDKERGELTREGLKNFLKKMNVIFEDPSAEMQQDEFRYFAEEYDMKDKEQAVNLQVQKLKSDFGEWLEDIKFFCKKIIVFLVEQADSFECSILQLFKNAIVMNQDQTAPQQEMWLRTIDFEQYFMQVLVSQQMEFPSELLTLFVKYHEVMLGTKGKFNLPQLIRFIIDAYLNTSDPYFADKFRNSVKPDMEDFILKYDAEAIKKRIIDALFYRGERASSYFTGFSVSTDQFEEMLSNRIFHPESFSSIKSSSLPDIIGFIKRAQQRGASGHEFNLSQFNSEIDQVLYNLQKKAELFRVINRKLESRGETFRIALGCQLSNSLVAANFGLKFEDWVSICRTYIDKPVSVQDQQDAFQAFPKDVYGQCGALDLIKDFKAIVERIPPEFMQDEQVQRTDREERLNVVNAARYSTNVEDSFIRMAASIRNDKMTNFGSLLKGKDKNLEGRISNPDFYNLCTKLFPELGAGDVVDMIAELDESRSGAIYLNEIKQRLDNHMLGEGAVEIKLENKVKALIDQQICDELSPRQKAQKGKPKQLNLFLIDMFSGLLTSAQNQSLASHLEQSARTVPGFLDFKEFKESMDHLKLFFDAKVKRDTFTYFKSQQQEKKQSMLEIQPLVREVGLEFPMVHERGIAEKIVSMILPIVCEQKIPLQDVCKKYETSEGSGQILSSDFISRVLLGEMRLKGKLTTNMQNLLEHAFNPSRGQNVYFDDFLLLFQGEATRQHRKVYLTAAEVEEERLADLGISQRKAVKEKTEPVYVSRSDRNTYILEAEVGLGIGQFQNPQYHQYCEDIMVATRASEKSVEGFFQKFGKFSPKDGIRHLTRDEFRKALLGLSLSWYNHSSTEQDSEKVKKFYDGIAEACMITDEDKPYGLTLAHIGSIVLRNAPRSMLRVESEIMANVYAQMSRQGQARGISQMFNFVNFKRTGQITCLEFKKMLKETYKLEQCSFVTNQHIAILGQRYRDWSSKEEYQMVDFYRFAQEISYSSFGIRLELIWATEVSEALLKGLQTKRIMESGSQGLEQQDVVSHVTTHLQQHCAQGSQGLFTQSDMYQTFKFIGVLEKAGPEFSKKLDNFLKLAVFIQKADQDLNPVVQNFQENAPLPRAVDFTQVLACFLRFLKKPLKGLYWDVIDKVYISSKARDINIEGPYIRSLFAKEQGSSMRMEALRNKILREIAFEKDITSCDIDFLLTKYCSSTISTGGKLERECSFTHFLEDYFDCEQNGLCESIALLNKVSDVDRDKQIQQRVYSGEGFRTLDELQPSEREIFKQVGGYLQRNDYVELYCGYLVMADSQKTGYLDPEIICQKLHKITNKLSNKQKDQLTRPLIEDTLGLKSYLELICFMFGPQEMFRLQEENGIGLKGRKAQVDRTKLRLTDELRRQIELNLAELKHYATNKALTLRELKQIFVNTRIRLDSNDLETFQLFLQTSTSEKVDWRDFVQFFSIDGEPSALLSQLREQIRNTGKPLDSILLPEQKSYDFSQFHSMLSRWIDLSRISAQSLRKLFTLVQEGRVDVPSAKLRLLLEASKFGKKKLESAPEEFKVFLAYLVAQKVPIFGFSRLQNKRIVPVTVMHTVIDKSGFRGSRGWMKFFEVPNKSTEFDLDKLKNYIFNEHPTFGQDWRLDDTKVLETYGELLNNLPREVKQILSKFCQAVRDRQLDQKNLLMRALDKNHNGTISFEEFDQYCVQLKLSEGISQESLQRLYRYLDANGDGNLSVDELNSIVSAANLTHEELMDSAFSADLVRELEQEIETQFRSLDKDGSGYLEAQELAFFMKQQEAGYQISESQAARVIAELNQGSDSSGKLSLSNFKRYVLPKQKELLLSSDDSMEDLRKLFEQFAARQGAVGFSRGQLNHSQLKQLIIKTGYSKVQDYEIDELFRDIDRDRSGFINVDEFMAYMYTGEGIKTGSRDTLFRIRKAHRKLNAEDVFQILRSLPKFAVPSFTQPFLEQMKKNTPASQIVPQFDYKSMSYQNLDRVKDYLAMRENQKVFIGKHMNQQESTTLVLSILDIRGVPLLKEFENSSQGISEHLELRVFLYEQKRKILVSSIMIGSAYFGKKHPDSTDWQLNKAFSHLIVRASDEKHKLVFELVRYSPTDPQKQISMAHASEEIGSLAKSAKPALKLKGGSPFQGESFEIYLEEDSNKKRGFLQSLSSGKKQERVISLQITQFAKADLQTQMDLALMPENFVLWKSMLPIARSFRLFAYEQLENDSQLLKKPRASLILSQVSNLLDMPDVVEAMGTAWEKMQAKPGKDKLETDVALLERFMLRAYGVVSCSAYKQSEKGTSQYANDIYITRSSQPAERQRRQDMLLLALFGDGTEKGDLQAEGNKHKRPAPAEVEETDYIEDYVPFMVASEMDQSASVMGVCREGPQHADTIRGKLGQLNAA